MGAGESPIRGQMACPSGQSRRGCYGEIHFICELEMCDAAANLQGIFSLTSAGHGRFRCGLPSSRRRAHVDLRRDLDSSSECMLSTAAGDLGSAAGTETGRILSSPEQGETAFSAIKP